jgi:hypothetical protein
VRGRRANRQSLGVRNGGAAVARRGGLVQVDRAYPGANLSNTMAILLHRIFMLVAGADRAVDNLCLPIASPLPWNTASLSVGWHGV